MKARPALNAKAQERTRSAVLDAVRTHEIAKMPGSLAHLADRLLVLVEQTMGTEPALHPITGFTLEGWRTEVRTILNGLRQEAAKCKAFHQALAKSLR